MQSLGQSATADRLYRRTLALAPDHAGARIGLAWLALENGDLAAAEALVPTAPDSAEGLWLAARVAFDGGSSEAAQAQITELLRLDLADAVLAAVGGRANVREVDAAANRLLLHIADPKAFDEATA